MTRERKIRLALASTALTAGVIGMMAVANWTGAQFGYQEALGGLPIGRARLYAPWAVFSWAPLMGSPLPPNSWPWQFNAGLCASAVIPVLSLAAASLVARVGKAGAKALRPFGEKHFGRLAEAKAANLIMGPRETSEEIRFVGMLDGAFLTVTDNRFIMVFGPSGSGKTRGVFIPTMLAWAQSALVYAAGKADMIEYTAGHRATFSDVRLLDLGDPDGWRFNPLDEVRIGSEHETDDCQLIAEQFLPASGKPDDDWFNKGAVRLISAAILHVLLAAPHGRRARSGPERANLGEVYELLHGDAGELTKTLLDSEHAFIQRTARATLDKTERQRDAVLGTAQDFLAPWASPVIQEITSSSDFKLSDLVCGQKPMTLYLRVPSDMRETWRPVLKVLIAQVNRAMMHDEKKMPDGRKKRHTLLYALDEFHSFALQGFMSDMAEMRSYGALALLGTQSPKSLQATYGPHETISENCRVQLYMATNDADTGRKVSDLIGQATEVRQSRSRSSRFGELFGSRGESEAEQTRAALDPGGVRSLDNGHMLLLATGHKPLIVEKMMDFETRYPFSERLKPPVTTRPMRSISRKMSSSHLVEEVYG